MYNIGTATELTVMDIAQRICSMFALPPAEFISRVVDRDFNDQRYFVDASKLLALGWTEVIAQILQ